MQVLGSIPEAPYMLHAHQTYFPNGDSKLGAASAVVSGFASQIRPSHSTTNVLVKMDVTLTFKGFVCCPCTWFASINSVMQKNYYYYQFCHHYHFHLYYLRLF